MQPHPERAGGAGRAGRRRRARRRRRSPPRSASCPTAVHTAAAAAAALGVDVGQIANSLIFDADGEPLLVLTSGAHRVDTARLAASLGVDQAAPGHPGVRPRRTPASRSAASRRSGHPKPVRTLVDTALAAYDEIWAAGGVPAGGLPDHLRRAAADHRRHARPRSRERRHAELGHAARVAGPAPRGAAGALARMAVDPRRLRATARASGSASCSAPGTGTGFGPGDADLTRWAALTVWDAPAAAAGFDDSPVGRAWAPDRPRRRPARPAPAASRGRWSGRRRRSSEPRRAGRADRAGAGADPGPAAAQPGGCRSGGRSPRSRPRCATRPGCSPGSASARRRSAWQGTVSVWRSATDLVAFAYRQPEHARRSRAPPTDRWYAEELFARFEVLDVAGDRTVLGWDADGGPETVKGGRGMRLVPLDAGRSAPPPGRRGRRLRRGDGLPADLLETRRGYIATHARRPGFRAVATPDHRRPARRLRLRLPSAPRPVVARPGAPAR